MDRLPLVALALALSTSSGCNGGPLTPSCKRRTGPVLTEIDPLVQVAHTTTSFEVTSPQSSNLIIAVTWTNRDADLDVSATIIECGAHIGCQLGYAQMALKPQALFRELLVDGSEGKRYRINVSSDRETVFTIRVTYDTGICT